uniref:WAP domain-containing protein n=1 Tax=Pelusios castaneus TaxID=367368 RepID=A0A8C8VGQ4_9SAUR
ENSLFPPLLLASTVFRLRLFSVPVKLGTCPPDYIHCIQPGTDECAKDSDCKEEKKCCYCHCAMRCVEPVDGK